MTRRDRSGIVGMLFCLSLWAVPSPAATIRDYLFEKYFLGLADFSDCPQQVKVICATQPAAEFCPDGLKVATTYAHLIGDDTEEALVQGTSCHAGKLGGPDIHAIFVAVGDGQVKELPLPPIDNQIKPFLLGDWKFRLAIEQSRLVGHYTDTSKRRDPVVVHFVWTDGRFYAESVTPAPYYKTSYDCAISVGDQERAVCLMPTLAELDLKLDKVFQKTLKTIPAPSRPELVREQKSWFVTRNTSCPIVNDWLKCLEGEYHKRIGQFEKIL